MLDFPYMTTPGGVIRPIIAVVLQGPTSQRLLDGLLDTGSDRTVFPEREAAAVGISLPTSPDSSFKTAGGVSIPYRLADAVLELRAAAATVRWKATVAFADDPLTIIHLGHRGFLEFFRATFHGPERKVSLDPQPTLPAYQPNA